MMLSIRRIILSQKYIPKPVFQNSYHTHVFIYKNFNNLFDKKNQNQTRIQPLRLLSSKIPSYNIAKLPSLSPTMETGNIAMWSKKEGDKLEEGETLCQIETDKAVMIMETPSTGYLAKILHPEGTKNIKINKPIAIIVKNKEDIELLKNYDFNSEKNVETSVKIPDKKIENNLNVEKQEQSISHAPTVSPIVDSVQTKDLPCASPFAKKIARESGIDLKTIKGSGPFGRILSSDVKQVSVPHLTKLNYVDIQITSMRSIIAKRLLLSKTTIPHFHLSIDIDMDAIINLRESLNLKLKDQFKFSLNDFFIKSAALTLKDIPECNSQWMETFIRQYNSVNISVAVATDNGLITPIIFDSDLKTIGKINKEVISLAEKARKSQLKPEEFLGGTFTISNLGMFGIKIFTAIINPPQSCILSVGALQKKFIQDLSLTHELDSVRGKTHTFITATLGCDHRVVDGAIGAKWLQKFKEYLENPNILLV